MIRYLFIFVFLYSSAWPAQVNLDTCSSLPYSYTDNDTITIDGGDAGVTTTKSAAGLITGSINSLNLVIDFENDTAVWNTGNTIDTYGIIIRNGCNAVIVQNGSLIDSATTATNSCGIYIDGSKNDTIRDMYIETNGYGRSQCIRNSGANRDSRYNIAVLRCHLHSYGDYFNRHLKEVNGIDCRNTSANPVDSPDFNYHLYAEGCDIYSNQVGIACESMFSPGGVFQIYRCTVETDTRNNGGSAGNPFGIMMWRPGCYDAGNKQSWVRECIVTSGTENSGGRGIMIEGGVGTASLPVRVTGCSVNVHQGNAGEDSITIAMKVRGVPASDNDYLLIDSNVFICSGDEDATSSYGPGINTIDIATATEGVYNNITVRHNRVECLMRAGASDIGWGYGNGVNAIIFQTDTLDNGDNPTVLTEGNHFVGCHTLVRFTRHGSAHGVKMVGDTVEFASILDPDTTYTFYSGVANWYDAEADTVVDVTCLNSTDDTAIFANSCEADIRFMRTVEATVNGNNSQIVPGADVWVINSYGDTVLAGTTDSCGLDSVVATYLWLEDDGVDSSGYDDYTVKAKKGTDSSSVTITVRDSSTASVTLSATAGNNSGCAAYDRYFRFLGGTITGVRVK